MESVENLEVAFSNVVEANASNVISNDANEKLQYHQTYSVKIPKEREKILVDVTAIEKIKKECSSAKQEKFPLAEIFLGISSLLIGAFISALMSNIPYSLSFLGVFSYSICPVGGVGFGVAYLFCRNKTISDINDFAIKNEDTLDNTNIEGSVINDEYK